MVSYAMPEIKRCIIGFLFLFSSSPALALSAKTDSVSKMINEKIDQVLAARAKQKYGDAVQQHATLLTPAEKLAGLCATPALRVPESIRLTGNRTVLAQCGTRRTFIQIRVEAEGSYWITTRALQAGQPITERDVRPFRGSLSHVPSATIFTNEPVIDAIPTRILQAGDLLVKNQLRQHWLAVTGKSVDVISNGAGFEIRAQGKAMANAAAGHPLNVRMKSGRIVSGIMSADGAVRISEQR